MGGGLRSTFSNIEIKEWFFLIVGISGVTISDLVIKIIPEPNSWLEFIITFLATTLFAFLLIWYAGKTRGNKEVDLEQEHYAFVEGSKAEAEFFYKWYSREGKMRIFCSDLEWLEKEHFHPIQRKLLDKKDNLQVYLKRRQPNFVNLLEAAGAKVYKVPKKIQSNHRFSTIEDDGLKSIIIRNKRLEPEGKIRIDKYENNSALVNLAIDMLDDLE